MLQIPYDGLRSVDGENIQTPLGNQIRSSAPKHCCGVIPARGMSFSPEGAPSEQKQTISAVVPRQQASKLPQITLSIFLSS
ncbi:hypothetical protein ABVT39_027808 [Epinephelus coioides]